MTGRWMGVALTACLVTTSVLAQENTQAAGPHLPFQRSERLSAGDFVGEIHAYSAAGPGMAQALATQYARLGRPDLAWAAGRSHGKPGCDAVAQEGTAADPLDLLSRLAQDRRVVMINENHFAPTSRAFWLAVLPRLRKMGFTHVALEALSPRGDDWTAGEVRESIAGGKGFAPYLGEPTFAAVIRRAVALGYTLVPYDEADLADQSGDSEQRIASRERVEAARLAGTLAHMPADGKLLVLAGWGHVNKGLSGPAHIPWMAEVLKQRTGIDPLTIDTTGCQRADAQAAAVTYVGTDGAPKVIPSAVGHVDMQVYMPLPGGDELTAAAGVSRQWLGQPVAIPAALLPKDGDGVVEARRPGQPADTAPYDRLFLRSGEVLPLYLPPGRYVLTLRGEGGAIQASAPLTVAAPELSQAAHGVAHTR
ncbi:hypothetical protein [Nitrospirillum sp. BR 11828]|uniref:hypothetical protein n=1 Tax=Nitrospirillum sp. BR 11828 TaxID=3104325 RepID=UPI002ACA5E5B|nr:hypothetical protein [Nitrospirillum sp. BR 11828]MDZ5648845.1 hypothetical protein [Nitrospirillum sp. BR 11828]